MEISRDLTFDEEESLETSRKCQYEELYEEYIPLRSDEVALSY